MECPRCKVETNDLIFNQDGTIRTCKVCKRADDKRYRSKDSSRQRRQLERAERKDKIRQYIVDYLLEHPCVDCGEKDIIVLDFDHLGNKKDDISNLISHARSLSTVIKEIDKCVVRCANCHRRRTAIQLGSYRVKAAEGERVYIPRDMKVFSHTVLTMEKAVAIRAEYSKGDVSYDDLAEKYGVSKGAIADVIKFKTWRG